MRGPESRTLGPIGTVGRYRSAKELTHCWLAITRMTGWELGAYERWLATTFHPTINPGR